MLCALFERQISPYCHLALVGGSKGAGTTASVSCRTPLTYSYNKRLHGNRNQALIRGVL
jgi:hypothetical protein